MRDFVVFVAGGAAAILLAQFVADRVSRGVNVEAGGGAIEDPEVEAAPASAPSTFSWLSDLAGEAYGWLSDVGDVATAAPAPSQGDCGCGCNGAGGCS